MDVIAANIQLRDFNGLHLVHLAATTRVPARALVWRAGFFQRIKGGVTAFGTSVVGNQETEPALAAGALVATSASRFICPISLRHIDGGGRDVELFAELDPGERRGDHPGTFSKPF